MVVANWRSYVVFVLLTAASLFLVNRDYQSGKILSPLTIAIVWASYFYQFGLTVYWALYGPRLVQVPLEIALVLGAITAAAGIWLIIRALLEFRSFDRMSGLQTDELVTGGVYRLSRNPQNVGWLLGSLGMTIMGRSVPSLLLVLLFGLGFHIYLVVMEEPHLATLYGQKYERYRSITPRYFGLPGTAHEERRKRGSRLF